MSSPARGSGVTGGSADGHRQGRVAVVGPSLAVLAAFVALWFAFGGGGGCNSVWTPLPPPEPGPVVGWGLGAPPPKISASAIAMGLGGLTCFAVLAASAARGAGPVVGWGAATPFADASAIALGGTWGLPSAYGFIGINCWAEGPFGR